MLETRNFLVPDATFAIEAVAFLVVLAVMTRWVLPRIRAAMHERQLAVADALAAARDAEQRRRLAEAEAAEIRTAARRAARRTKEQAWAWRDSLIADAKRAGIEEYRWLAGRADREQQRHRILAEGRFRQQASAAATAATTAYLGSDVDRDRIAQLVNEYFDRCGSGFGVGAATGPAAGRTGTRPPGPSGRPWDAGDPARSCVAGS
jgi:F0F1-type ATP synthase membrane subunit b/b'